MQSLCLGEQFQFIFSRIYLLQDRKCLFIYSQDFFQILPVLPDRCGVFVVNKLGCEAVKPGFYEIFNKGIVQIFSKVIIQIKAKSRFCFGHLPERCIFPRGIGQYSVQVFTVYGGIIGFKASGIVIPARRVVGNWRHLWSKTGQIVAIGTVGYYSFTTIEGMKIGNVNNR